MDAACTLYKQKRSCKNVTMDEIAAYCGISKRTLYECFSNKEQLVFESMNRIIQYIYRDCEKLRSTSKHSFEMFFGSIRIVHEYFKDVYCFAQEIRTNYPDIFEQIISSHIVFAKTNMIEFLEQAKKEGFIWKHINEKFFMSILDEYVLFLETGISRRKCSIRRGNDKVHGFIYFDERHIDREGNRIYR